MIVKYFLLIIYIKFDKCTTLDCLRMFSISVYCLLEFNVKLLHDIWNKDSLFLIMEKDAVNLSASMFL